MKPRQTILSLTVGLIMMLGAIQAQAATVITDGDNNVLRINNLELNFDQDAFDGFYNVEFVTDTGVNQYGDPPTFDVALSDDAAVILPQITEALNMATPTPTGASPTGSDTFFIPGFEFPIGGVGDVYLAAGAEFIGGVWGDCKNDCLLGVRPLNPNELETYARVSAVPIPAAAWLFGSGLLGLIGMARRKKAA